MDTYIENIDGGLSFNGVTTPSDLSHRGNVEAWKKVDDGTAVIDAWVGSPREAEYLALKADNAASRSNEAAKLAGVLYGGVMCSATAEDQHGLADVESFILGGQSVNFKFENGNSFVLTAANWAEFRGTWVAFRFSFFPLP